MQWREQSTNIINIRAGEAKLVILMMVSSAATGIAINYYFTASSALFLAEFAIDALPYTILFASLALFLTQALYRQATTRVSPNRLQVGSLICLVALLAIIRLSFELIDAQWLAFVILVLFRVMILLLTTGFSGLADRIFTRGQNKRLLSLIGAGEVIAVMLGSFMIPIIVDTVGTENLFLVVLASMVVNLVAVLAIQRRYQEPLAESETMPVSEPASPTGADSPPPVLGNRYVQLIFALFVLAWTANYALDYSFLGQLQARYAGNPEQIAGFIGIMFGIIQLAVFALRFFISDRLLSRYGLRFGLLAPPVLFTVGVVVAAGAEIVAGSAALFFWLIVVTKYSEEVLRESFSRPSTRILYQPMPIQQRSYTRSFVEGSGFSFTALIAGAMLVAFTVTGAYTPLRITFFMVGLGVAWIILAVLTYDKYTVMLRTALTTRRFRGDQPLITDAATVQHLTDKLDSERPDEVIYALDLLDDLQPALIEPYWLRLLSNPAPEVRTVSLNWVERNGLALDPTPIWALVEQDLSPAVRAVALRTYCALASSDAIEFVSPYLEAPLPELQRGAMVGMLRYTGVEGILLAGQKLKSLLDSSQPADRLLAAQILGDVGEQSLYQPLVRLLADSNSDVVEAALVAAGHVRHARLWPPVIDAFSNGAVRAAAFQAVVLGSPESLEEIKLRLWHSDTSPATRIWLLKACGRIGGQDVIDHLVEKLDWPDAIQRTHVLMVLCDCGYRAVGPGLENVKARIAAEASDAVAILAHRVAFNQHDQMALLAAALHEELQGARNRLLMLLSFLYDRTTVLRARHALQYGSEVEQSYALEVLDIVVEKDLKQYVRLLFDTLPDEQHLTRFASMFPQPDLTLDQRLRTISAGDTHSPWLRSVALYTLAQILPCHQIESLLGTLASASDPLLQKTAIEILARNEEQPMLSTIEKVIILKTVTIFSGIPDGVIAELAQIVEEQTFKQGEVVFEKGDLGSSMYIIVSGRVRAHDGSVVFNTLGERDVFGEMAVLDPEPRVASITAEEDTLVFRLDQIPFYEVMADYPEISHAVIRVVIGYLRDRVQDVSRLSAQVEAVKQGGD